MPNILSDVYSLVVTSSLHVRPFDNTLVLSCANKEAPGENNNEHHASSPQVNSKKWHGMFTLQAEALCCLDNCSLVITRDRLWKTLSNIGLCLAKGFYSGRALISLRIGKGLERDLGMKCGRGLEYQTVTTQANVLIFNGIFTATSLNLYRYPSLPMKCYLSKFGMGFL